MALARFSIILFSHIPVGRSFSDTVVLYSVETDLTDVEGCVTSIRRLKTLVEELVEKEGISLGRVLITGFRKGQLCLWDLAWEPM